jgi:hypothetical protein
MRKRFRVDKCADVKPWVMQAIQDEERHSPDQLWKKEPSAESIHDDRLRRIKFLRKHSKTDPKAQILANRLESCGSGERCLSGACPECGRLFQRWFVRRSRKFVAKHINLPWNHLVAVSIVPWTPTARKGQLYTVDVVNLQRRLKDALKKANIDIALGGIDFSFNEDDNEQYVPFWCPHFYLITSTGHKKTLRKKLRNLFLQSEGIPRPVKISDFDNRAYCRSYALKMTFNRRVGYWKTKERNGELSQCRDTSGQRLRAAERLELFIYLDQIGLGPRIIFRRGRPVIISPEVKIEVC